VRRRRGAFEPSQNLRQLLFEELELSNLLLHGVQLLRHQGVQSGAHG
jgi:hypothetical protein